MGEPMEIGSASIASDSRRGTASIVGRSSGDHPRSFDPAGLRHLSRAKRTGDNATVVSAASDVGTSELEAATKPVKIEVVDLLVAADRLQQRWDHQGIKFCFIGGIAVQHWGEPRMTNDVDVTVAGEFGAEKKLATQLLRGMQARINDAIEFATINRVLLMRDSQGISIDASLAAMPFELGVIERSKNESIRPGISIRLCSANDLVILKAFANRPRDWQDIQGILVRSNHLVDRKFVREELTILAELKEEPEIIDQLKQLFGKHR